jgi:pentatricopeptide repeat protein
MQIWKTIPGICAQLRQGLARKDVVKFVNTIESDDLILSSQITKAALHRLLSNDLESPRPSSICDSTKANVSEGDHFGSIEEQGHLTSWQQEGRESAANQLSLKDEIAPLKEFFQLQHVKSNNLVWPPIAYEAATRLHDLEDPKKLDSEYAGTALYARIKSQADLIPNAQIYSVYAKAMHEYAQLGNSAKLEEVLRFAISVTDEYSRPPPFDYMQAIYSTALNELSKSIKDTDRAFTLFLEMQRLNIIPLGPSMLSLLIKVVQRRQSGRFDDLVAYIQAHPEWYATNVYIYNHILRGMINRKGLGKALEVFEKAAVTPDSTSFAYIIAGALHEGRHDIVLEYQKLAKSRNCDIYWQAYRPWLVEVIRSNNLKKLEETLRLLESQIGIQPGDQLQLCHFVIEELLDAGHIETFKLMYARIPADFKNLRLFNVIINGYIKLDLVEEAVYVFKEVLPQAGFQPDLITYNALIQGLLQKKNNVEALRILDSMPHPSISTYNTFFTACAKQGDMELFKLIEEKFALRSKHDPLLRMDCISFNAKLQCLLGVHDVMAALITLRDMEKVYHVKPNLKTKILVLNYLVQMKVNSKRSNSFSPNASRQVNYPVVSALITQLLKQVKSEKQTRLSMASILKIYQRLGDAKEGVEFYLDRAHQVPLNSSIVLTLFQLTSDDPITMDMLMKQWLETDFVFYPNHLCDYAATMARWNRYDDIIQTLVQVRKRQNYTPDAAFLEAATAHLRTSGQHAAAERLVTLIKNLPQTDPTLTES